MFLSSFTVKNQSSYGPITAALRTAAGYLRWEIVTARMLQKYDEMQWDLESLSTRNEQKKGHTLAFNV